MGAWGGTSIFFARDGRSICPIKFRGALRVRCDGLYNEIRLGKRPAADMPAIRTASHEIAWTLFASGPRWHTFANEQFPWRLSRNSETSNSGLECGWCDNRRGRTCPGWRLSWGIGVDGPSESGFFPERTALVNPANLEGLITIETECPTTLTPAQISTLAGIPVPHGLRRSPGDVRGTRTCGRPDSKRASSG